jgi:hypothetical protein
MLVQMPIDHLRVQLAQRTAQLDQAATEPIRGFCHASRRLWWSARREYF